MIKHPFLCTLLAVSVSVTWFAVPSPEQQAAHAQQATGAAASSGQATERVKIYSDKVVYKRQLSEAVVTGRVKIIQDNTTIYADEVLYKENTKESFVEDGVKIVQINKRKEKGRQTVITAQKMHAFHAEKRIQFTGTVRMDRAKAPDYTPPENFTEDEDIKRDRAETSIKKAESVVTADYIEYFTETENADLDGNVVMLQKDKKVTGDKARIRGPQEGDTMVVEGNAKVTQIRGNWLVVNKIIKPDPKDVEQQRLLREKLLIEADKITVFRATDDLKAEGNVKITQKVNGKDRIAVGKEATYSDAQQLAVLTGDVKFTSEKEEWLTAEKALFYTEADKFEALGTEDKQVESEFLLDEDGNRKPPPLGPTAPPFDLEGHQPGQRLPAWLQNRQQPRRNPTQPVTPSAPALPPALPPAAPLSTPPAIPAPAPSGPPPAPPKPPKPSASAPPPRVAPSANGAGPQPTPLASSFVIEID